VQRLAEDAIREALEMYTRLENDRERGGCLVILGGIAVARGSYEAAAQLFGAAEALRGDSSLERAELMVLERFEPELEAALGAPELTALKARGAGLESGGLIQKVVLAGTQE
jgi:hypothetical protein